MDVSFQYGGGVGAHSLRIEAGSIKKASPALSDEFVASLQKYLAGSSTSAKGLEEYLISCGATNVGIVRGAAGWDMDQKLQAKGFKGMASIKKGKDPILVKGYPDTANQPITSMTTFRCGSITKSFTAALFLHLQDSGKLDLDNSLEKYFPIECRENPKWREITLRMLLNHTSGMKNNPQILKSENDPLLRTFQELDHLLKIFSKHELLFQPGAFYHYSNPGYILLALIAERVTHKTYREALEEMVVKPREMHYTDAPMDLSDDRPGVSGLAQDGKPAFIPHTSMRVGTGNLISNVHDLEKWMQTMFNPKFLSPGAISEITHPHPQRMFENKEALIFYSMGWRRRAIEGSESYYHTGVFPGCRTMMLMIPEKEVKLTLLSHYDFTDKKDLQEFGVSLAASAMAS